MVRTKKLSRWGKSKKFSHPFCLPHLNTWWMPDDADFCLPPVVNKTAFFPGSFSVISSLQIHANVCIGYWRIAANKHAKESPQAYICPFLLQHLQPFTCSHHIAYGKRSWASDGSGNEVDQTWACPGHSKKALTCWEKYGKRNLLDLRLSDCFGHTWWIMFT